MPSDIHVVVRFQDQSVFAGEQLRCTITFKNVANLPEPVSPGYSRRRSSRRQSISQLAAQSTRNHALQRLSQNGHQNDSAAEPHGRYRATASLQTTVPVTDSLDPTGRPAPKQRSVSIISVTSPIPTGDQVNATSGSWATQQRLSHQRSSTVQSIYDSRQTTHLSPISPGGSPHPSRKGRRNGGANGSRESTPDFSFPPPAGNHSSDPTTGEASLGQRLQEPAIRVTSRTNQVASERSSGDFYSLSNHSQETLMSEQQSVMSDHRPTPTFSLPLPRRPTAVRAPQKPRAVSLLMGYVQFNATFTLDASLIDQSQFEEVKSKGFLGGQAGGGVVGVKRPRPNSGFLGGFNLSNIGGSFNSLIGGDDMSSVKEMNAVTTSRAIPLLSSPQSLLFVDMHLEPGEEQSYSYVYPLPAGLPSSHRGKAIKISYNLTVGVQGLPGGRDVHAVRQVNVPVRVFSGVNYDGDIFGHDLMQPHVILRDLARTKPIFLPETNEVPETPIARSDKKLSGEFLQFVDKLLDRDRRRQSSSGTMVESFLNEQDTQGHRALEAIDRAILYSNQTVDSESSPNRFEITRNGLRVAVIVIDRPLHRLGETITAVIDFSEAQVPCASLRSTLETSEKVSPSLAVRSTATVNRVTRRVYAAHSETILFAKRATFAPSIPATATPTFVTSGINLDWSLRFEFGTIKPMENEEGESKPVTDLLEEVTKDERGAINVAVENLECETFEAVIPITVYGDLVPDGRTGEDVVGIPI
ncbi:Rgp1-domain-containing protein [Exophiala viscosa]|uniref:Rgp1-domain-containing protein n=1 Tax=Exophiala viscosa TaxID=2486360 RepID=A0AAN6ID95_9EURO|nr:Rgp1-domain-containing protein [Exophiala viscosa]